MIGIKAAWLVLVFASNQVFANTPCVFDAVAEVIAVKEHELHQVWTLTDSAILKSKMLPSNIALDQFRHDIQQKVPDVRPDHLLKRQYQDFLNSADPSYSGEAENPRLAFTKEAGKIRSINCLEASLLSVQLERLPMVDQPTEFVAFILSGIDNGQPKIRVYYSTTDTMGVRGLNALVLKRIEADLASGWVLASHLHNHPFDFKNSVNVLGSPSPSLSDVQSYRSLSDWELQSARITNGFDTIEIS